MELAARLRAAWREREDGYRAVIPTPAWDPPRPGARDDMSAVLDAC
eukprot:gene7831-9051_t